MGPSTVRQNRPTYFKYRPKCPAVAPLLASYVSDLERSTDEVKDVKFMKMQKSFFGHNSVAHDPIYCKYKPQYSSSRGSILAMSHTAHFIIKHLD